MPLFGFAIIRLWNEEIDFRKFHILQCSYQQGDSATLPHLHHFQLHNSINVLHLHVNIAMQNGRTTRVTAASSTRDDSILTNEDGEEVFVKGVGMHVWQSSGDQNSNWTHILRSWHPLNFPRHDVMLYCQCMSPIYSHACMHAMHGGSSNCSSMHEISMSKEPN